MITLVETEDVTLKMNHCTMVKLQCLVYHYVLLVCFYDAILSSLSKVGCLRHVVENSIGGVKKFSFFAHQVSNMYLKFIGEKFLRRFRYLFHQNPSTGVITFFQIILSYFQERPWLRRFDIFSSSVGLRRW